MEKLKLFWTCFLLDQSQVFPGLCGAMGIAVTVTQLLLFFSILIHFCVIFSILFVLGFPLLLKYIFS